VTSQTVPDHLIAELPAHTLRSPRARRIVQALRWLAAIILALVLIAAVWAMSLRPHSPPLRDNAIGELTTGVATLEHVTLNGAPQWISIRGYSDTLPVLLYLSGGPCGSEMAWMRHYHALLERHYLVVNWDQRCAGKSYGAADWARLTPADIVADAGVLIDTLLTRYRDRKLLLVGNSWGSIVGAQVAARWPQKLHAYVGVTQQVNVQETDSLGWSLTRAAAARGGRGKDVDALDALGPPPYSQDRFLRSYFSLINLQNRYGGTSRANAAASGQMRVALTAVEYGAMDRLHWVWSLKRGWETLYSQLAQQRLDLEREIPTIDVPVYLLLARRDLVVPPVLAERWLSRLQAPRKEIVWFDSAGHTLMVSEAPAVDAFLISLLSRR
jgi:pimeloyl-ACP methyl ester carboxylesterase